jgi:tetratricopeptide (TPR) repeat protein
MVMLRARRAAAWPGIFLLLAVPAVSDEVPPSAAPPTAPEAISLLGKPLVPDEPAPERRRVLEDNLARARTDFEAQPGSADAAIWLGRRLAYLGRFRDAIAVYTRAIAAHPRDPRLLRHRGHRFITLRRFDDAIADFDRAAVLIRSRPDEVEPDGQPNALNIPTSTLHFNIWYHLGLAHYLKGDFGKALSAYRRCMDVSRGNDDRLVATTDWTYMTLRRLGRPAEAAAMLAPIHRDMKIIEDHAYHRRLLMYKGEVSPDELLAGNADPIDVATQGYGVGNWHLYNGRADQARAVFDRVVKGSQWAAFGFIAAEAELAREWRRGGDSNPR